MYLDQVVEKVPFFFFCSLFVFHYDSYDLLPFFPFGYALVGNVMGDGETSELVCTCTRGDFWGMFWVGIEYVVHGPRSKNRCLFFMGVFFLLCADFVYCFLLCFSLFFFFLVFFLSLPPLLC